MSTTSSTNTSSTTRPRRLAAALGVGLLALGLAAGSAAAKEPGSGGGGGGGGTAVCSPISNLTLKADARVGETGLATIDVGYGVKPCINGQAVTVAVTVAEWANPAVVLWDDQAAPLNGKFTVAVRTRVTYKVTVTVYDAATGAVAGVGTGFAAAIPKGV